MGKYNTLSEAINDLTIKGYTHNFNIKDNCLECADIDTQLQPDEFEIDEIYRFEEMSDVDTESMLYAISSKQNNIKGLLVSAFGVNADSSAVDLIKKLYDPMLFVSLRNKTKKLALTLHNR